MAKVTSTQPITGVAGGQAQSGGHRRELLTPGAMTIHQDGDVFASVLSSGATVEHRLRPGRHAWVQVAAGAVTLNGQALQPGDGARGEPGGGAEHQRRA